VRSGQLVGASLVLAMVVAVAATRHAHPADGSPIDPHGAWRTAWVLAVAAAFALYALGLLLSRSEGIALRFAVVVAVVVQLLPLAGPLLLSRDVFLYWSESRLLTVHHANPYTVTPSRYPNDAGTRQASVQWRTQTDPYGPGWVALATIPAEAAGDSHRSAALLYRVFSTLALIAAVVLVAWRTRRPGAVVLLGWSPLVALHFAGGGHSDSWIALALVSALAWRGSVGAGAAWSLGASMKAVPAILLPIELARARLHFRRSFWIGLIGTGAVIVVAATALFGPHWVTATLIGAHGTSPIGGVHFLTESGLRHRYAVVIGALVFACVYVWLLREAWFHGRARLSLAASALCMCSSLLRPWYAIWPLALGAMEQDTLAEVAVVALSAYVLFADAVPL
jgi:hypothetical protein